MNRYKYLEFPLEGILITRLCKKMQSNLYSDRESSGFLIDEVRKEYATARFIRKIPIKNEIVSPAGKTIVQRYTTYETVAFEVRKSFLGLILKNPPRSTNSFVSALGMLTDFKKPIRSIEVDLNVWLRNICVEFGKRVVLKSAECEGIKFKDNAIGTLIISSKEALDMTMKKYLGDRRFGLKKIKLEIDGSVVVINKNCTFSSSDNDRDYFNRFGRTLENSISFYKV